jgi:hypothetical protein
MVVEHDRQELELALAQLKLAARRRFGLGEQVARHPWQFVLSGALLGYWLGSRGRR